MKKRKVSSGNISQDIKTQNSQNTQIEAGIDLNIASTKSKPCLKNQKEINTLADISHKNTSGANNWQTFLKLNPPKREGLGKPNIKKTNRPYYHATKELPVLNPVGILKEKKVKNKKRNDSAMNIVSDELVLHDNVVKCVHKTKHGESQIETNKLKPVLTKQIAMDCEMVGVEVGVNNNMLARISLVNAHGDCIYDKYVKPTEPVIDFRTGVSGIRPKDLEDATDFKTVQQEVADIVTGRILVGHALHNDLRVLFLTHPRHARRDTSTFKRFRVGPIPSLKGLAKKYLGVTIQDGEHSSKQDALAAMQLYKMFKKEWEASFFTRKTTNHKAKKRTECSAETTNMDI